MNQAINKIPYGLLTEEEQAQFRLDAKQRGLYEIYYSNVQGIRGHWADTNSTYSFQDCETYRLKMVPGEIYYCENSDLDVNHLFIFECKPSDRYLTNYSRAIDQHGNRYSKEQPYCGDNKIEILRPASADQRVQFNKAFNDGTMEDKSHNTNKKEKWKYWQKDCECNRPKEGTYKNLKYWNHQIEKWVKCTWGDEESFVIYRYKKVQK